MIAQSIEINVFNFVHRFSRFLKLKHRMRSLCKIIRFHVILARHGYVILFYIKLMINLNTCVSKTFVNVILY